MAKVKSPKEYYNSHLKGSSEGIPSYTANENVVAAEEYFKRGYNSHMQDDTAADRYLAEELKEKKRKDDTAKAIRERLKSTWKTSPQTEQTQDKRGSQNNEDEKQTDTGSKKQGNSVGDFFAWLGKNSLSGLAAWNKALFDTMDFIVPDVLQGKYDPIKKGKNYYTEQYNIIQQAADAQTEKMGGGGWYTGGEFVKSVVKAAPDAILALLSSGASKGANLIEEGATIGSSVGRSGIVTGIKGDTVKEVLGYVPKTGTTSATAQATARAMVKNPAFWSSFMQEAGSSYEDAKMRGANEVQATLYGTTAGLLNAGVEVGGGIQNLPQKLQTSQGMKKAAWEWVKSSLEEGEEEIVQGTVSNALAKMIYNPDMKIWSTSSDDNDTALFNPVKSIEEGAMGAAVGAVLGGGQTLVAGGINRHNTKNARKIGSDKVYNNPESIDALIEEALEADPDSDAYRYGELIKSKVDGGKKPTKEEIGTMVILNTREFTTEENKSDGSSNTETAAEQAEGADGISDRQDSGSVQKYEGGNKDVERIDNVLGKNGASDSDRMLITSRLDNISRTKPDKVVDSIAAADKKANEIRSAVKANTGADILAEERYKLVNANLGMAEDGAITNETLNAYSQVYTSALARGNAADYVVLAKSGIKPESVLTAYLVNGTIPENMNSGTVMKHAALLSDFIANAAKTMAGVRNTVFGNTERLNNQAASAAKHNFSFINTSAAGNVNTAGSVSSRTPFMSINPSSGKITIAGNSGKTGLTMSDNSDTVYINTSAESNENNMGTEANNVYTRSNNTENREQRSIDTGGTIFENDNGLSSMPSEARTNKVQEPRDTVYFGQPGTTSSVSGRRGKVDGGIVNTKSIEEICDDDDFVKLEKFVGGELSSEKHKELYSRYCNDERINNGYDFYEIYTYDMLSQADNELRELFADNIDEYFNSDKSASKDITGKEVSDDVQKATKNSVVKNANGQLIPVYHGTGEQFESLRRSDIGIHFGSYAQAAQRVADKGISNPRYIRAYLNIENPIVINEDFFNWNSYQVAKRLWDMGILTRDETQSYFDMSKKNIVQSNDDLVRKLQSKGYDGIVYNNEIEAVAGKSYIVFDNGQIFDTEQSSNNAENTRHTADNSDTFELVNDEYKVPGLLRDEYSDELSTEERTAIDTAAKAVGATVKVVPSISGAEDGMYYDGVIYLSLDADDKLVRVFAHEITHYLQETAPESYKVYRRTVLNILAKEAGTDIDSLVKEKIAEYAESGIDISDTEAMDELAADFTKSILEDPDKVMDCIAEIEDVKTRKSVLRNLIDAISNLIAKIKGKFKHIPQEVRDLQAAADLFSGMLKEASDNVNKTKSDSAIKYSIRSDGNGNKYVYITENQDIFDKADEKDYKKIASDFMNKTYKNATLPLSDYNLVHIDKTGINKYNYPGVDYPKNVKAAKSKAAVELHNLLEASEYVGSGADSKNHSFAEYGFEYYKTRFVVDGQVFDGIIDIGVSKNGATFYGMSNIERVPFDSMPSALLSDVTSASNKGTLDIDTIPRSGEKVKRFSLKKDIEETKDLIAVHNINQNNLLSAAELGGLAMPSIAVTKAEQGHSGFGDITLLFDKNTIDPQVNEDNKVYAGDAYTPMFPKTVNKPNEKALAALSDKLGESVASLKANYFEDKSTTDAAAALESNQKVRKAFADEKDYKVVPVTREPEFKFFGNRMPMARDFIRKHSFNDILNNPEIEQDYLKSIRSEYPGDKPRIRRMKEKCVEMAREIIEKARSDASFRTTAEANYNSDVDVANGKGERITDAYSYRDGLSNLIKEHKAEFEEYTKAIAESVMGEKYIRNNKDVFDQNDNRRGFSQLYDKYTLDNVVANMKAQLAKGQGSIFTGASEVRGAVTKELYSIRDIKTEEGKIRSLSDEETEALKDEFSDRLSGIISEAVEGTRFNYANALNDFSELIIETANKSSNADSFIRTLKKDGSMYNINDDVINDVMSLLSDMQKAPVKYFEAKPQRAVGFDEVCAAIVPDNVSDDVTKVLNGLGIPVTSYESNNSSSRVKAVNKAADEHRVRFSLKKKAVEIQHTPEQLKVMEEYEKTVDTDILDFVKYAREHKSDNRTSIVLSEVNDRGAKEIERLTGIDVTGFEHSLKTNTIRHIDEGHGVNGITDNSMSDDKDIARIQYTLDNYDSMELLETKSKEYRDKNQRPAPMIKYSKRIDGTYYVVEAVPDTKKHQLAVVTAYKNKAAEQQTADVQAPALIVRNASADAASMASIPRSGEKVNTKFSLKKGSAKTGATKAADLSQKEYAMVSRAVMAKNAGLSDSELKPVDYVYAADRFFLYRNHALGDFTVIDRFDTETDFEKIDNITEVVNNGTYRLGETFNSGVYRTRSRQGSDTTVNSRAENGRAEVGNDRLSGRQRRGNAVGHTPEMGDSEGRTGNDTTDRTHAGENSDKQYSLKNGKTAVPNASNFARELVNDYGVKGRVKIAEVSEGIEKVRSMLYDVYFGKGDVDAKYSELESAARKTASEIADNIRKSDNAEADEYNRLRNDIKNTPLKVTDTAKSDFGDWNEWKKSNYGFITVSNDGIDVDSYYKELTEQYPQYFNEQLEMTQSDQLERMVSVLRDIKPKQYALDTEERNTVIDEITADIIEKAMAIEDDLMSGQTPVRSKPEYYSSGEVRLKVQNRQIEVLENARAKEKERIKKQREKANERLRDAKAKAKDSADAAYQKRLEIIEKKTQEKFDRDMKAVTDKFDKRLAELKSKHEEHMNKQKEQYREKLENEKRHERERLDKQKKQMQEKVRESKAKAKERRMASEDRRKLLRIARRVNNMKMSDADRAKIPDIIKELDTVSVGIREKGYIRKDGVKVMGSIDLQQLKNEYEKRKKDVNFMPDKEIEKKIKRLDKMQISDMDIEDVRDLINTVLEAEHEIRMNTKLLNDAKNKEIAQAAAEVIGEVNRAKGISDWHVDSVADKYITTQLSPMRMFRRLAGYAKNSTLETLGKALNDGQRKSLEFRMKANRLFDALVDTKENKEQMRKFTGKHAEWINIGKCDPLIRNTERLKQRTGAAGEWVKLSECKKDSVKLLITPAMRVALYLHSQNYENLQHIVNGGITIPDQKLFLDGKIDTAYESRGITIRLTPKQVNEITGKMSTFEKRFADAAYKFFNVLCKNDINETSLILNGYEKAIVDAYFPLVSNKNFIGGMFESLVRDGTLEGMGILKERNYASNPIVLEDVTKVIARHTDNVGDYCGLAVPIRNFEKVYNAMRKGYSTSTKDAIKAAWGMNATKYIDQLLTDLQGKTKGSGTAFNWVSNYAQATLMFNVGVTLKQSASYPTAAAVVGWKPLMQAFGEKVGKDGTKMIAEHTPLLWYRSKGYTTSELGDYTDGTSEDWTKKMPKVMGWIQGMDVATTTKLWKAAEYYVRDNFKGLKQGSDKYYNKVAEIYNDIIELTQPNYTTMQRPDILRKASGNAVIKAVTMFKTQPMQNFNIVYDSFGEFRARYSEYKANPTEETKADMKTAKQKLMRAVSSQLIAALVLNAFDMLGKFLLGKFEEHYGGGDDDEEEENANPVKNAIEVFIQDNISTIAGNLWFGSEASTVIQSALGVWGIGKGATWYDLEQADLSMINNIITGLGKANEALAKGKTNPWTTAKNLSSIAYNIGTLLGIPAKNVKKLLMGIYRNITDFTKSENIFDTLDAWSEGYNPTLKKDDTTYKANMSVKEFKQYDAYYNQLIDDMEKGKIVKKGGEKYDKKSSKQRARKLTNEKFSHLFTEKVAE